MYEVLIVEDDPMVAMINRQYVSQDPHFHVCSVCDNGVSGLEFLKENKVDLIILDKYMPQMNGITFLRKMHENNISTSVIMVTAANDCSTLEEALNLGVVDYLVKPFLNSRFQQALNTFLSRQNAFHDISSFSQKNIDAIINNKQNCSPDQLPKGIQNQTLETICRFFGENSEHEFTGEEIADKVGLSRVTVRRYMNYMMEKGTISGRMNYETGGRPCMLYRWS